MLGTENVTYTVTYSSDLGFNTVTVKWPHPVNRAGARQFLRFVIGEVSRSGLAGLEIVAVDQATTEDPSLRTANMTELARLARET